MTEERWFPGSFTKHFAWEKDIGLKRLHDSIRIGFDNKLEPVHRVEYRQRIKSLGRPDLVPINFFLFNYINDGRDFLDVDELVFQALTSEYSSGFDKLAIFAFNFSCVGAWNGMKKGQRYPALWARNYVIDRLASSGWDTRIISAKDIQEYLKKKPEYQGKTYEKLSTNLNNLYEVSNFSEFSQKRIERWWVDCLFLALDRLIADRKIDGKNTPESSYPNLLLQSKFKELTGPMTPEKTFAMGHLVSLYTICRGADRFSPEKVQNQTAVRVPNYLGHQPNDNRPQGALHPTNPRILKSIPRDCAELAKLAGFEIVLADDLENFNPTNFIEQRARDAAVSLKQDGIKPIMSPEELHRLTREE
jgi:hypothetical protein